MHSLFSLLLVPWFTFAQGSAPAPPSSYDQIHRLTDQGKFDEALSALSEIVKSHPGAKNLSHEFGVVYYRKGDYLNAISSFERAIAENPNDNEATQLTGLSLYLAGKPSEAIPYLEKVQSWYPSASVDASYILGIAYIQTKSYSNARTALRRCFKSRPIPPPPIFSPRASCFALTSVLSRKNTAGKPSSLIPSFRWRINS